jgi:uncharacterized membrane protein
LDEVKRLSFVALMAALANVLSVPPIAIPILIGSFQGSIHFTQLPILVGGILAGPAAGLMAGAIGGLFAGFAVPKIPFVIGGLAILGCTAGFFAKRFRPFLAGILAWLVQAPYVAVSDYVWFTLFLQRTPQAAWTIIATLMVVLTVEVVISSILAEVIIAYLKKARITL